uniref:ELM1/GtrOC1 family putative glycosyltransferase n=1 Tax=Microbulbifer agarilyticus TaxID=260552 RepID=UPI0002557AC0|nr:ELM1/GtrOC1 family putative glycosyltransferase [Microbulbifer agarilyticus]
MVNASSHLNILLLSDGIPGHVNQAHGFVDWLRDAGFTPKVQLVACALKAKWLRPLLALASNHSAGSAAVTRAILAAHTLQPYPQIPHLIVSAGGNTRFANSALARLWGCPNVFIGSPRNFAPHAVTALLTLEPATGFTRNNLIVDFAPARTSNVQPSPNTWALLLGGDGSGYRYQQQDWQAILQWARDCAKKNQIQWLVAGSRRSPPDLRALSQEILREAHGHQHCWPGDGGELLAERLPRARQIVCTEDSMSMLCEAINLPRPLLSLRPAEVSSPPRYQQAIEKFAQRGYLQRACASELARFDWAPTDPEAFAVQVAASRRKIVGKLVQLVPALEKYRN